MRSRVDIKPSNSRKQTLLWEGGTFNLRVSKSDVDSNFLSRVNKKLMTQKTDSNNKNMNERTLCLQWIANKQKTQNSTRKRLKIWQKNWILDFRALYTKFYHSLIDISE